MASQRSIGGTPPSPTASQCTTITQEQEICFVNTIGKPAKGWRANNKTVRSHVMRRYKRQERTRVRKEDAGYNNSSRASTREPSIEAATTSATDTDYDLMSRSTSREPSIPRSIPSGDGTTSHLGDESARSIGTALSVDDDAIEELPARDNGFAFPTPTPLNIRTWLDGNIDPFACLPIQSTPRRLMLLQQNAFTAIRTSVHTDAGDVWRRSCSSNQAWLYMTLFYASARFPGTSTADATEDASYLLKSISAINDSISETPGFISDSTIATVACLANIDNLNGVSSNATVHTNGLIRMVELRGGLSSLGMRGILRRMVLWSDLLASSRLGRPPSFPLYQTDTSVHLSAFTPSVSPGAYHLISNKHLGAISTVKHQLSISQLMLSLHQLSLFLNLTDSLYLPWEASYPDRVYQVEYHFLAALFDDQITAPTEEQLIVGDVLFHAGLLFIYTNLRETPVGGAIRRRLLARLKTVLENFESPLRDAQSFTAEIFWALLLGASASTGADQGYFVKQLKDMSTTRGINSWPDAIILLENVPALEAYRLNTCKVLWNSLRAGPGNSDTVLF